MRYRSGGDDVDDLAVVTDAELHAAVGQREQGVILAHADIDAGVPFRAALTNDDVAWNHGLIAEFFNAETTAIDLVAIESSYNEMAASRSDPPAFQEADIRFHNAILLATHNVVIQQLSDAISALQRAIFEYTFRTEDEHITRTIQVHQELFEAIRCRNAKAAEEASLHMVLDTERRAVAELGKDGVSVLR